MYRPSRDREEETDCFVARRFGYLGVVVGVGLAGLDFAASSGVEQTSEGSGLTALSTSTPKR